MYKIRKIVFHEHPVLKNLSLNFCDSEGKCIDTIIFAGENGTGKSTIINSIYMLVSRTANFEADVEFEKDGNPFQITYEYRVLQDGSTYLFANDGAGMNTFLNSPDLANRYPTAGIYSDVDINFHSKHLSSVTSLTLDATNDSRRSSNDLPTQINQISNYDNLSAVFDAMKRINTIMVDMNRDFWQYISMEYFKQKIKAGEVGSSAMPHKVNPIDFENAEGNLGIATSILEHLAVKLPVSRLQRDLTDSTVLRNVGVPFGHIVIAIQSSLKGLRKLLLNEPAIYRDLDNCWSVVAEAIQTILRREAYPHPYEALKALTRTNQAITENSIKEFIEELNVNEDIKKELRAITPHTYTGL